jgi:hypothetical protein
MLVSKQEFLAQISLLVGLLAEQQMAGGRLVAETVAVNRSNVDLLIVLNDLSLLLLLLLVW